MHRHGPQEGEVVMIGEWWLLWMVITFALLVPSLVYGWGYRKWGPPYPRYIQRRRAAAMSGPAMSDYQSWGWVGDFVWIVTLIALFWAGAVIWWR
jgi:hypothetical protein